MNKLKDFFYNKNDIIIVLLILAVAALIIYTRIDSIMDYPEKLAADAAATQTEKQTTESTAASAATTKEDASAKATTKKATGDVSIKITDSDDSISVATKLYKAGLVESDTEFESYITNMGKESSLKTGTFKIPAGSTEKEILSIIAN